MVAALWHPQPHPSASPYIAVGSAQSHSSQLANGFSFAVALWMAAVDILRWVHGPGVCFALSIMFALPLPYDTGIDKPCPSSYG